MNVIACLKILRPLQWLKNLMIFFPPLLGGSLSICLQPRALIPFGAFCLVSSATYILNDILDRDHDSHHPEKRLRPLPAGLLSVTSAWLLCVILLCLGAAAALIVSASFFKLLSAYLFISTAYSLKLKEIALIDIFCISSGFLLRLEAGGAAFNVVISEWLFLTVFLLAIFLSTGKRLGEKKHLGDAAENHRKSLLAYPKGFLEGTMYMTGSSVLVTYTMYVISRHSPLLLYSVPLCCFGLLRYMLRVHQGLGGDPTDSLIKDVPLFCVGLSWVILFGFAIYGQ
jgi:decaprenyl-phosphate phosphoribosyltransferase